MRMKKYGKQNADDKTRKILNADRKLRMTKCGKEIADDKMRMTKGGLQIRIRKWGRQNADDNKCG